MANYLAAPAKTRTPRASVRTTRRRRKSAKVPLDRIETLFTKFLSKRVGRTWESVYRSIQDFTSKLDHDSKMFVEALYDTYIDLHPRLRKDGIYERQDGIPLDQPGLFFVDLSGILRGTGEPKFTRRN